jgi:ectonucleotide pyrophosphatase/phosphodiesterase family protein 5
MTTVVRAFVTCLFVQLVHGHKHSMDPLVLLVSFDGFRWDYLVKHNLPNFNGLKLNGSYADWIYNSFATVTFPNHWTIATGLYEESHGIVHNHMFDPVLNETFNINMFGAAEKKWFAQNNVAEPIWITNQKAGGMRHSAAEWVASDMEVNGEAITSIPYNHSTPFTELIDRFISLYTDEENPINFGAIYFDEPGK